MAATVSSSLNAACDSGLYCLNGGSCTFLPVNQTASCECPPLFSGPRCELPALTLFPCPDKWNNCMNGGQCVMEPKSGNTMCLCPASFDGYRCQATSVLIGAMDENNASNLRLYTIIGIILGCCALVGIAAMTVVKTRSQRRKKHSKKHSKKRSRKPDPEKGEGTQGEHIKEQLLSKQKLNTTSSIKRAASAEPMLTRGEAHRLSEMRKPLRQRQSAVDSPGGHVLNRVSSEPKRQLTALATSPARRQMTEPATPPSRRQARMADLTEQLLSHRSASPLLHGSESCLIENKTRHARNGSLVGFRKASNDSNHNVTNNQGKGSTRGSPPLRSTTLDVPAIHVGAVDESDKLLDVN